MIVMKFGGTSVEDAVAMKRVIEIVQREVNRKPLVVLSASSGVTNELLKIARTVLESEEKSLQLLEKLHLRHRGITKGLLNGDMLQSIDQELEKMFQELRNYIRGIHLLG